MLVPKGQDGSIHTFDRRQHSHQRHRARAGWCRRTRIISRRESDSPTKSPTALVVRGGYGIFYGGYETGPWSNPSPGFNPPFFVTESFNQPCGASSANPAAGQTDCSIPGLANLSNGFPASSLTDPNTPQLLQLDPKIANPYMQQWNLSTQYELPAAIRLAGQLCRLKGNEAVHLLRRESGFSFKRCHCALWPPAPGAGV